jgi:hypothetical protein
MILLDCVEPHINSHDIIGRNRLHLAVLENDVEAVQALLSLNINRDKSDRAGLTPLHYAYAIIFHTRIIELLEDIPMEGVSKTDNKGLHRIIRSLFRSSLSFIKRWSFYIRKGGNVSAPEVVTPQSHYDDHSEGTESIGDDHCPPTSAELKSLCSQHPSLWARYCQCSQTEMSRRAAKWPEEVQHGCSIFG